MTLGRDRRFVGMSQYWGGAADVRPAGRTNHSQPREFVPPFADQDWLIEQEEDAALEDRFQNPGQLAD